MNKNKIVSHRHYSWFDEDRKLISVPVSLGIVSAKTNRIHTVRSIDFSWNASDDREPLLFQPSIKAIIYRSIILYNTTLNLKPYLPTANKQKHLPLAYFKNQRTKTPLSPPSFLFFLSPGGTLPKHRTGMGAHTLKQTLYSFRTRTLLHHRLSQQQTAKPLHKSPQKVPLYPLSLQHQHFDCSATFPALSERIDTLSFRQKAA